MHSSPLLRLAILLLVSGAGCAAANSPAPPAAAFDSDVSDWFPFEFPLHDTNRDSIDLSGFLHVPAGRHGFVTARDGRFHFTDGRRARFFGTNVGGPGCAPPKEKAAAIADRLAKYGVNLLRLHAFDSTYGKLIDYSRGNSQHLDPATLDRLDYFIAALKQRGIYVYLDLLDYRQFRSADGVKDGDAFTRNWAGSMKGASIFDERMIELQKDYATKLLTHRNPYTRLRYVDEPAVAVVEITNENTIFYFFRMAELSQPSYRDELTRRWNAWLRERYPTRAALESAWSRASGQPPLLPAEDPVQGTVAIPFGGADRLRPDNPKRESDPLLGEKRIADLYRFFAEIQRQYYQTMIAHLKQIGVRVPIAGSNQTFHEVDTQIEGELSDFISRNQYWRHPNVHAKPPQFSNQAMLSVDIPTQRNPLSDIASTSIAGRPHAVAEFNFPWPNEARCEGWLMSTAYACLQDWDMFLLFSYDAEDKRLGFFKSQSDPARWGTFPAAALMFHRQDVSVARNEVHVVRTPEDTYTPRPDNRHARATNHRYLTFLSKVRNAFIDDAYRGNAPLVLAAGLSAEARVATGARVIRLPERPWDKWLYPDFVHAARRLGTPGYERMDPTARRLDSDTGELSLDYGRSRLTISTPRTKSVIGEITGAAVELDGFRVGAHPGFAAITATSLDGEPIGRARRVLVTAVGRARNTGQILTPPARPPGSGMSWQLTADGAPPVLVEPVRTRVRLAMPGPATVHALDASGRRTRILDAAAAAGGVELDLASARTIWLEVISR